MHTYLEKFTPEKLEQSRQQWIDEAINLNLPTIDIEKVFAYAVNHIDYENVKNDSLSYAIFCEKTKDCVAVVDIVVSNNNPQKKFIKMLTVDLCPRMLEILTNDQMDEVDRVIDVYCKATLGTILLTWSHKVDIVKLYGRSQSMRLLLKSIESSINAHSQFEGSTNWEGNWLTITPSFKKGKK